MINKNQKFSATIKNYGCNAEGVATANGQVVFVPYTLVGEQIDATIINTKSKFAIAKATNITSASPLRTAAPCPYFSKCGGCQLQHTTYQNTLAIKQQIVQDAISSIGKINHKVLPCVPSQQTYEYRNKFAMPINPATKKLCMYRTGSHNIVDIDKCLLQKPQINKLVEVFNSYLQTTTCSIFDDKTKNGVLKHLVARQVDNKLLITVVINSDDLADKQNLVEILKNNFDNFGLSLNINTLCNNVILTDKFKNVYGPTHIEVCENDIKYQINNQSFLQINDNIKKQLYSKVFEQINNGVVIDAYSGAGLLSALMSKHTKKVFGIEIVKPATQIANDLKQANNIKNLENINGDCTIELPKLVDKLSAADKQNLTIVLDPPRKGCSAQVLQTIVQTLPQKIIYISCNPSTLARDLQVLLKCNKYKIKFIEPYDMFPQTKHVETLAVLELV